MNMNTDTFQNETLNRVELLNIIQLIQNEYESKLKESSESILMNNLINYSCTKLNTLYNDIIE